MNIFYNDEFEHAITENQTEQVQNYRVLVAVNVTANVFEHNEQVFDVAYHFMAQDSMDYDIPQMFLARPEGAGYGMVTVYRVPGKFEVAFRARVGKLFQSLREGQESPLHYQESGYVWVYMKKIEDILWAFASDDARNYYDFADLNPESEPLDIADLDQEEVDTICAQRVVRMSGDENSDNGFENWIFSEAPFLYRELRALDFIAPVDEEE